MTPSLYLQAANCKTVDRFPIWFMRQAGRYMKDYQKIRKKHSMKEMISTPEIACEVTLQPIKSFGMDAAIIFSDILTVPDALGVQIEFVDGKGPIAANPVRSQTDIESMDPNSIVEKLGYVMQAITLAKQELKSTGTPLIGFAGSPFTVASYIMGEGQGHNLNQFMEIYFSTPQLVTSLLDKLAQATILYLNQQIKAGVDAIQIFDSWSSVLPSSLFGQLSLSYLKQIIQGLENPQAVPIALFGTAYSSFYPRLQGIGANVISIDSRGDLAEIRKITSPAIAIQGNLDPYFLLAPKHVLEKEVKAILNAMKGSKGYIFNLGHGVFPQTSEDHVKFVVELVQNFPAST